VVEMGMSQQYSIYRIRRNRKRVPVAYPEFPFLIKATINQKPEAISFQQVCRAGYILGCAQEY
jgi:hypothetical protein